MKYLLFAGAAVTLMVSAASAQNRVVDQSNPTSGMPTGVSVPVDRYESFGQSFTPNLNSIDFATFNLENQYGSQVVPGSGLPNVGGPAVPALYSVSIYRGYGTYNSTTLLGTTGTTLIPATAGLSNPFYNAEFDFASSISLTAGQQYTLILNDLTHTATPTLYDDVSVQAGGDRYAGGKLTVAPGGDDLIFSEGVFGAAAAVPEPATWAMIVLGMGTIGFAMRRRKFTARVFFAA